MASYANRDIEKKWQAKWKAEKTFKCTVTDPKQPHWYILDMFPYPSGAGLHVGHPKGYVATDVVARFRHANGYNVLHTMGWDAFGLPAENYAIKTGTHPRVTTEKNVQRYHEQLESFGFSYDWDREINTTDPQYYRWSQWIFSRLFEHGLAFEQDLPINYCPSCKTGLANEEVVGDNECDRCGTKVERRKLRQWVLKITAYADRLLEDLDGLAWPEGIKEMQRNWIGKSEGVEFSMKRTGEGKTALILHGWAGSSQNGWKPWMKRELEALGYRVFCPDLPNSVTPNLDEQLAFIEQYKNKLDEDSIIVGHSLGGFLGCHFLAKTGIKVAKMLCVGSVYNGLDTDTDFSDKKGGAELKAYTARHVDEETLRSNGTPIVAFLSEDDHYVPFSQAKAAFGRLGAKVVTFADKGHFNEDTGIITLKEGLDEITQSLSVYTTRLDTVYGMTYAVIAPDHPDAAKWIAGDQQDACEAYIEAAKSKSDLDRTGTKEKTGVFTGSYVVNPFTNESIPVYFGDYVLGSYGTGAVMAVPAHDERDYAFAQKMGLPIEKVIVSPKENAEYEALDEKLDPDADDATNLAIIDRLEAIEEQLENDTAYTEDGFVIKAKGDDDEFIDSILGASSAEARKILGDYVEQHGFGKKKTNYKLRDWLFSRQRYWGEPIPLVHLDIADIKKLPHISTLEQATDADTAYILKRDARPEETDCTKGCTCHGKVRVLVIGCKEYSRIYDGLYSKIVCDPQLPLELPEVERYEPAGDGQSPLATVDSFVNVRLASNLNGKRETNTMPQWAGSCWYYLRFMDPNNSEAIASKEALNYWKNVDEYVGGAEHAVLHLLYARFWHKFLFDLGIVPTNEPFTQLMSPGLILGADGNKMSKSKGNVVNPDDVIAEFGSDTFRLYEMSMSDFRDPAPWNTNAIAGVSRFLDKAYALFDKDEQRPGIDDMKILRLLHKTIKKVGDDIGSYKFNTAISAMMILLNEGLPNDSDARDFWKESFVTLLHPFAPHLAEELWEKIGKTGSVYQAKWPEYQPFMLVDDEVTIAIQVNGKLRGTFPFMNGVSQEEVSLVVHEHEEIRKWTEGKTIVREIFVPNKLLNIVVKDN